MNPRSRQPLRSLRSFKRKSTSFSKGGQEPRGVADLDLDGLCANSGRITAGMDLLVPRYRAFAVLMEELGDMQQALLAGGAANQFTVDVKKSDATAPLSHSPPSQPESSVNQSTDKPVSEVEDMASVTSTERALHNSLQLLTQPRSVHHLNSRSSGKAGIRALF